MPKIFSKANVIDVGWVVGCSWSNTDPETSRGIGQQIGEKKMATESHLICMRWSIRAGHNFARILSSRIRRESKG